MAVKCDDLFTFFYVGRKEFPVSGFVSKPGHPLAETQTEPCKAESSFSGPSLPGQVGRLHRWRQSGSTFRRRVDSKRSQAGHISSGAPFRGRVDAWVGGWADKTNPKKLLAAG